MENSKKKIFIISMIGILVIGASVYLMEGGSFLQGRLARNLVTEDTTGARENPTSPREMTSPRNENVAPAEAPRYLTEEVTPPTGQATTTSENVAPVTSPRNLTEEAAPTTEQASPPAPEVTPTSENVAPAEEPGHQTEEAAPATDVNPTPTEEVTPATDVNPTPTEEAAPATDVNPTSTEEAAPATDVNPTPTEEASPSTALPVIFDTANFNVPAILEPLKSGGFNLVSQYTTIRYGQNSTKDSYRISIDLPTYQGDDKQSSYKVSLSAVVCKESTCAKAHTEDVTVYKDPWTSDQKYTYFTVTRGELYDAVQASGAKHGDKIDFKAQIQDPNGTTLTSNGGYNLKVEDDALKLAFNLANFKLTKGEYVPATDGPFIQLNYTQTDTKTNAYGADYFYTGDQASFKFFIEVCDAANPTICGNYLETQDTDFTSGGGAWPIPISDLKIFTDNIGFTAGTKLLFKLAVQDNIEGATKYYAKGFYLYLLGN